MQVSHKARRGNQSVRSTLNAKASAQDILNKAMKPVFENLERRQMLSTTLYVNDNWVVSNDPDLNGLSVGDTVEDSAGTDNNLVSGLTFGTNAFDNVADALAAAVNGDTVHLAAGSYSVQATINKEITLAGDNVGIAGTGSRLANESILNASNGALVVSSNNVTIDGLTVRDASTNGGRGIHVTSGSNVTIAHNIITQNSVGVVINTGVSNFVVSDNLISSNNRSGTNRGQGVRVVANTGTGSIVRNRFTGHNSGATTPGAVSLVDASNVSIGTTGNGNDFNSNAVGIRVSGTSSGIAIQSNTYTPANTSDVIVESTGASVISSITGNAFNATSTFIDYAGSGTLNAASNTFGGVTSAGNSSNLTQQYAIVNKIQDGVDVPGRGMVRIDAGHIYVTQASETLNAGALVRAVGFAGASETVHVGTGSFFGALDLNVTGLTIAGAGAASTTIDVTGLSTPSDGALLVDVDNVTLSGFTLDETAPGTTSGPRYGIYGVGNDTLSISNVVVQGLKRSGFNFNGSSNITMNNNQSLNNGGAGIFLSDVDNAHLTNTTTLGNPWTGVSVATFGRFFPIGTSGIVIDGTNSFGETSSANGGLQLEMADWNNVTPAPITWSTSPSDNAMVTIQASDFGYVLDGPQDTENYSTPNHTVYRPRFYKTLANAQSAAGASPDHMQPQNRTIRTTGSFAALADYYVFDVSGKMSIQAAVNDSSTGDTIHLGAGTFEEQVTINKNITLTGQGATSVIKSPTSLALQFTTSGPNYPVVYVNNAGNGAEINQLKIDGAGRANGNYRMMGLAFYNAAGTVDNVTITGIRETPLSGAQQGTGLYVFQNDSVARTIEVTNSIVTDYQKNGIVLAGAGLTVDVQDNTVTGVGDTIQIAQNGIQVSTGAGGTVSGNTVSGHMYSGGLGGADPINDTQSAGILIFGAANGTVVSNNIVNANDIGIYNLGNSTISGNQLGNTTANRYEGIFLDQGTSTVSGNTIIGGNIGLAVYSFDGNDAATSTTVSGNTISGTGTLIHLFDDQLADAFDVSADIDTNTLSGTGSGIGIDVDGATARIENNNLANHLVGIAVSFNSVVDAGSEVGDNDPTGLGASAGNNVLTGYSGSGGSYAIRNDNTVPDADVYARNNNFGAIVTPAIVEGLILDNSDPGTRTEVIFADPQNLGAPPSTVWVDDDWASASPGADADLGSESNGSVFGYDQFSSIQDAIDAVEVGGQVLVAGGNYIENLTVDKTISLRGAQAGNDARLRTAPLSPADESIVTAASALVPTLQLVTGAEGTSVNGMAFSGGGIQLQTTSGQLDSVQLLNNRFEGFTGSGLVLIAGGDNMTIDRNSLDGTSQTGSDAIFSVGTATFRGLFIRANLIRNGGANNAGLALSGDHNVFASPSRASSIGATNQGNTFRANRVGLDLGTHSFTGTITFNTFILNDLDGLVGGPQNSTISQNTFDSNGRYALNLTSNGSSNPARGAQNTNVINNFFKVSGTADLFLANDQAAGTIATNLINRNSFASPTAVIYNGTETMNLTNNWFNAASGPSGGGHVGAGAALSGTGAANLDVAPWLRAGTDVGGVAANGFQPNTALIGHDAVTLTGASSSVEGSPYTVTYSYNGDADLSAVTSFVINWGDGTSTVSAGSISPSGTFTHTYASGPSESTIQAFAIDPTRTFALFPVIPVTVSNVIPTFTISSGSSATLNEGGTFFLTIGAISDPGADGVSQYRINWGDGSFANANPSLFETVTNNNAFNTTQTVTLNGTPVTLPPRVVAHVMADDYPSTNSTDVATIQVGVVDNDSEGIAYLPYQSLTVTVVNTPSTTLSLRTGTVTYGAVTTINEGSTNNSLTFGINKAFGVGDQYTYSWAITKNAGAYVQGTVSPTVTNAAYEPNGANSTLSLNVSPTFDFQPNDNGTYVVTVNAVDNDGGTPATLVRTFIVANVNPVATISPTAALTINEGATSTLTGTSTDVGAADGPFTYTWKLTTGTVTYATASTSIYAFNPNDNGTYVATLSVTDKDNGVGTATKTIIVNNVNPTATIAPTPSSVVEGTSVSLSASQTDPGSLDAPFTYAWNVARGTITNYATQTSTSSAFNFTPNDQGNYVVTLVVRDKDNGASATVTRTITGVNAAPTPSINGAPATSAEGSTISLAGAANDPGAADTVFTYAWNVTKDAGPFTASTSTVTGTVSNFNLVPTDNGVYVVSLTVTDNSSAAGVATAKTITVNNVNPTPTITGAPVTSAEGASITLGSVANDPGSNDTFSYSWTVTKDGNAYGTTGTNAAYTFTPDDNAAYVVSLTVTDDDGGAGTTSSTITVTDVAPTVSVTGAASLNEGSTHTITLGSISDPAGANDTITQYRIIWGDGQDSGFIVGTPSNGSTFVHRYDDGTANRTITVELLDEDGLHSSGTQNVTVNNVNPTGTFTGGANVNLGDAGTVIWSSHTDPSNDDNANLVYDYDFNGDGTYEVIGSLSANIAVPASYLNTVGSHTVKSRIRDNDGGASAVASFNINVNDATLRVVPGSFNVNSSGFSVQFNKSLVGSVLNLYDGDDVAMDSADIVVTAAGNPGNPLHGSMVYDSTTNTLTWVATGGVLSNDTYSLTLVSGANAFTHGGGDDLDGNTASPGLENYSQNFVVSSSTKVISLPDIARGAGQNVKLPTDLSGGLPISINDPTGVTGADFDLYYNPQLLTIGSPTLAPTVPGGWTITFNSTSISPTLTKLRIVVGGAVPLSGSGLTEIVRLPASVPNSAPYGDAQVVRIENVNVNASAGRGDYAVHKAVYVGDTNRDAVYTGSDKTFIDRVIANLDTGFDAYDMVDPAIVADLDGNGVLQTQDSSWLAQKAVNAGLRPEVPNIPGIVVIPGAGPDPTIDVADNVHVTPGGTVVVPLSITDSAAGLRGFSVTVSYDPTKLSLAAGLDSADVSLGSLFTSVGGWSLTSYVDQSAGKVNLFFSRIESLIGGTGTFANLNFTAAPSFTGFTTISTSGQATDSGLSFTYKTGSVTTEVLEFRVDAPVQSIVATGNYTPSDLVLSSVPTGNIAASYNAGLNQTTFTFPGYANGILPNGNYQAVIAGTKTLEFFVLGGDANRDRKVDINDLNIVASNWLQSGKVFSQGDFNYDGTVNSADLAILSGSWQQSITAPASLPVSTSAPAASTTPARRTATRALNLTDLIK